MALIILNQTSRFSWPFITSAGLHVFLIAGLVYATFPSKSLHSVLEQHMKVILVASELEQATPIEQPPSPPVPAEQKVEKQPVSEYITEPLVPVQMPKPKPKRHREIKLQPPKLVLRPATHSHIVPSVRPITSQVSRTLSINSIKRVSNMPQVILRTNPIYPSRARVMGIEGYVSVMYDVNTDGLVENVRILSAKPRNMFERSILLAMRHWTYEPGRLVKNLAVNFKFALEGVSNGE